MEFIYSTDQDQIKTVEKKLSPKDFLLSYPRGVYTLGILSTLTDFNDHIERLCSAVEQFYNSSIQAVALWRLIKFAVSIVQPKFRFTLLIYKVNAVFILCLYVDEPILNNAQKSLWVYGHPRENPHIKETGWIRDRQYIVDKMPKTFNEAILTRDRFLYEGLTSNICFVFETGIKTPMRSLVLPGLFLKKVENLCKDWKIPFEEDMISLDDVKHCIGIFITNMGQGVQWVKCVQLADESDLLWVFKPNDKISALQERFILVT